MIACSKQTTELESYFQVFRQNTIGHSHVFESPFGTKKIIYADWTASGRCYQPIEECIQHDIMPYMANTHTGTSFTGALMSTAYEEAKQIIKQHVHAEDEDVLIFCGSGMTGAVNKLQRMLGMRFPEQLATYTGKNAVYPLAEERLKPIVFITEMEHHSNQVSWLETIADVEIIPNSGYGNVDLDHFSVLLEQFKHRKYKIAAVTACSNVTGIQTPYYEIAKMIHNHNGLCFVDFACSAQYVDINMHPDDPRARLDAIYFSPHKFLGGPGTPGVLIAGEKILLNKIPDQPGGGIINYSNPWKEHDYCKHTEQREDGGTPPILQGIKAAMCVRLKEEMGVDKIARREEELLQVIFNRLSMMKNVELLEGNIKKRLGIISFIVKGAHHNLVVKMMNDRFGVQTRGGCSCAATYGHRLLHVDRVQSYKIMEAIRAGDLMQKPGWIRLSIHPVMTNAEIDYLMDAIEETAIQFRAWAKDYMYDPISNEYNFTGFIEKNYTARWFDTSRWE